MIRYTNNIVKIIHTDQKNAYDWR